MNKQNYFLKPVLILAFIFFSLHIFPPLSPANAQLPPEMQMDVLMTELKDALKAKDNREVLKTTKKLRGLSSDLPNSILFIEARAQAALKRNGVAKKSIESYLKKAGKDGKFYSQAIKLYVVVNKRVAAAKAVQAKKTARNRKAQQAVKKKADKKKKRAAADRKKFSQVLYLPGHPLGFAKLPDGRFAVQGLRTNKPGTRLKGDLWVSFFQANGKLIRTYFDKAPAGMKSQGMYYGSQISNHIFTFPGGKYLLKHGSRYSSTNKKKPFCTGQLMFSAEGLLIPREDYPPSLQRVSVNGSCKGRGYAEVLTATDGTGILITRWPDIKNITTLNSAGGVIESRDFKRGGEYLAGHLVALRNSKFVTAYNFASDWKLHRDVRDHLSSGTSPKFKSYAAIRQILALPSGGWSFLLSGGGSGSWAPGIKVFAPDGTPEWHVKQNCRGVFPTAIGRDAKSIIAIYQRNTPNLEGYYNQCIQTIMPTEKKSYKYPLLMQGLHKGFKEIVRGFIIDQKSRDRLFVIDVPKRSNGYLMRTDAELYTKQW